MGILERLGDTALDPLIRYSFERGGIKLEKIALLKHSSPRLSTLRTIANTGLLHALLETKSVFPGAITEIALSPIIPMTGRWEVTDNPFDRLFIAIKPDKYIIVRTNLALSGFSVKEDTSQHSIDPYFFEKNNHTFVKGVQNNDLWIIQTDFPRSEKLTR